MASKSSPTVNGRKTNIHVNGTKHEDPTSKERALRLDQIDHLQHLRAEFRIPSIKDLKSCDVVIPRNTSGGDSSSSEEVLTPTPQDTIIRQDPPSVYLCGNSLGVQPHATRSFVDAQLQRWAQKGVYGHFKDAENELTHPWLHLDSATAPAMARLVGAQPDEVVIMQTLTANLHLMMASFYRPTQTRYKVIIEGKAFPSDHYAVESQIKYHKLDPASCMICIDPPSGSQLLTTDEILAVIDEHASSTALLLLPGIQYYTGQFFDMKTITAYAQSKGITVGWDLAHAVANVPLELHDWNVDFAIWCTYKYMNCGPGAAGGLFVHKRHGTVQNSDTDSVPEYLPRLAGWWGNDKTSRFSMHPMFQPTPGAAGFQLSNPSALDFASILGALSIFDKTSMSALRAKSLELTGYLEELLIANTASGNGPPLYSIITPRDPEWRGAQLSVLLQPGLLDPVMKALEDEGIVVDERRPDVVRVAPTPLYNTFYDVWRFAEVFQCACECAVEARDQNGPS